MSGASESATLHASAVLVGEAGILIRGASGAGKSTLARELIRAAEEAGRFGRLVSDDRVIVEARNGRLIARAAPSIPGQMEIRGVGVVRVPYEPSAVIRLVVDIEAAPARLPADGELQTTLASVSLPRITVNGPFTAGVVFWRLDRVYDRFVTVP